MSLKSTPVASAVIRFFSTFALLLAGSLVAYLLLGDPKRQPAFHFPGPFTVRLTQPLSPGECVTKQMPKPAYAITVCMALEKDGGQ
jgi:hypothetical protein